MAGVVPLSVAVEEGLPTRAMVFDEGIEDPIHELWEGHDVLIVATTMSLEQVSKDAVENAVGEECEGLEPAGGDQRLGVRCPSGSIRTFFSGMRNTPAMHRLSSYTFRDTVPLSTPSKNPTNS